MQRPSPRRSRSGPHLSALSHDRASPRDAIPLRRRRRSWLPVPGAALLAASILSCQSPPAAGPPAWASDPPVVLTAVDAGGEHLENVWQLPNDVLSGSAPASMADLDALAALGVRTIVCVDGLAPDAEAAAARGMRVVHVPIRYASVDQERRAALIRAFEELPRPLYVHCHHGKHRGPAAAAWAMTSLGEMDSDDGLETLRALGTSPRYVGLYADVAAARPWSPDERAAARQAELPPRASVGGPVRQMAEVSRLHEHLLAIEAAGWQTPVSHPDLVASSEAAMLRDRFRDLLADAAWADHPPAFRAMLATSEAAALELERALDRDHPDVARATAALAQITADCRACHIQWRNAPLD